MKVNKYIFEVGYMNKQKLPEIEREKKEEKGKSGPFSDKRGERQWNIWGKKQRKN